VKGRYLNRLESDRVERISDEGYGLGVVVMIRVEQSVPKNYSVEPEKFSDQ